MSDGVLISGVLALEKDWGSFLACHPPHTQGFPGGTQTLPRARTYAVIVTSGLRVRSGFPRPQSLSSLALIKPESLLGPPGRVKVLGFTSLGERKTEIGEGNWGTVSISGLIFLQTGLGLPHGKAGQT